MKKKYFSIEAQLEARNNDKKRYRESLLGYKAKHFVAWDGEGFDLKGVHRYGLLMNSEGDIMYNLKGLGTEECLNFLCDVGKTYIGENSVHICFGASYDTNMILHGLEHEVPYETLLKLFKTGKCIWRYFLLEWRPRKFFTVARFKSGGPHWILDAKTGRNVPQIDSKLTLWDVFGFFQGSFLKALDEFFTDKTELEALGYTQIKEGKERRGSFTPKELKSFIIPYTTLEVNALVKLMQKLQGYCLEAGIRLKRWDGAGAVASAMLDKHKIKQYYGDTLPDQLQHATQHAYGGGRNEIIRYGHYEGNISGYDICSAYPSAMLKLPSLAGGTWYYLTDDKTIVPLKECIAVYHIKWNFPSGKPFYPFFYRDFDMSICYPPQGETWVWWYELSAYYKHAVFFGGTLEILEQWLYSPSDNIKPYQFVQEYYDLRRKLKDENNGMQIVYKLGVNSLYGKTVQHVGYEPTIDEETGEEIIRLPPYFNLVYGGCITSSTRAKLFLAAMQQPYDIVAMATDGLWSTAPLKLDIGKQLGQWEHTSIIAGTFVQSGVYWLKKEGETKITERYRGFNPNSIQEQAVLDAWENGKSKLDVPTTRFITAGSALASKERYKAKWCVWDGSDPQYPSYRTLKLDPTSNTCKRQALNRSRMPHRGLVPTIGGYSPLYALDRAMSTPFPLPWVAEDRANYEAHKANINDDEQIQKEVEDSDI